MTTTALLIGVASSIEVVLKHADGSTDSFKCNHTLRSEQIDWFKAGSALNHIASQNG